MEQDRTTAENHVRPSPGRKAISSAHALRWTARALAVASLACLGWATWTFAEAAVVGAVEGHRLDQAIAAARAEERVAASEGYAADIDTPPAWGEVEEGGLVGRIDVDRLGISTIVLHGTSSRTLRRAVGHIPGTALPGEEGNVGLAGHRDTFFRELHGIEPGDTVSLTTLHGEFRYRVDTAFVAAPSDVHVLAPSGPGEQMVTLVTCYPFYYVGPAPERFVVQGARVEEAPRTPHSSLR